MAVVSTEDTTTEATLDDEAIWFLTPGHPKRGPIRKDPFPFYDRLREHNPVFAVSNGTWLVSSYDRVNELLREDAWKRDPGVPEDQMGIAERVFMRNLAFRDPPDHDRLRRIVSPLFTPAMAKKRVGLTQDIVNDLLAEMREREEFDFFEEFASAVPLRVICKLLGIPADRHGDFLRWAASMVAAMEPGHTDEDLKYADVQAAECVEFFSGLAEERHKNLGDDILSLLLTISDQDDAPLTVEELVAMCIILHVGGHETTSSELTNGMYLLDKHPDAYSDLRADPSLVSSAVEEILRFESAPRNTMTRIAPDTMTLGGETIEKGAHVYGLLAAAGRDPKYFDNPHTFDIRRTNNKHLTFGFGLHYCVGASLARTELNVVFDALAKEPRRLELVDKDPEWRDSCIIRSFRSLPVRWV